MVFGNCHHINYYINYTYNIRPIYINLKEFRLSNNPSEIQNFPTDLFHNLKKLKYVKLISAGIRFHKTKN